MSPSAAGERNRPHSAKPEQSAKVLNRLLARAVHKPRPEKELQKHRREYANQHHYGQRSTRRGESQPVEACGAITRDTARRVQRKNLTRVVGFQARVELVLSEWGDMVSVMMVVLVNKRELAHTAVITAQQYCKMIGN